MTSSRRTFIVRSFAAGTALVAAKVVAGAAPAAAKPGGTPVKESDPQAAALGFKLDTAKADQAKFPKHAATQKCSNCVLYQGKAGAASGPCAIFVGKSVPANGWCSAWVKKA